jgi:uncharacterized membrane protein YqjE
MAMRDLRENSGGMLASLRKVIDGGLGITQNRVELFAIELREEKCRLINNFIQAGILVALGSMALALLTGAIIVQFWHDAPVAVLLTLATLYFLGAFLIWRSLRSNTGKAQSFPATLGEIRKDRECLRTKS